MTEQDLTDLLSDLAIWSDAFTSWEAAHRQGLVVTPEAEADYKLVRKQFRQKYEKAISIGRQYIIPTLPPVIHIE